MTPELQARAGYFEVRQSKSHPWVGVHIARDLDGRYSLTRDGVTQLETWEVASALELFAECLAAGENAFSHPLLSVWLFGREVDETQYRWRLALAQWAREHAPAHPAADPRKPIDLATIPINLVV